MSDDIVARLLLVVASDASGVRRGEVVDLCRQAAEEIAGLRKAKGKKPKGEASPTRGTRLPADWAPNAEYARSKGLTDKDISREAEAFRDWWPQQPGRFGIKLDWSATWRTWCVRAAERLGREPPPTAGTQATATATFDNRTWAAIVRRWQSAHSWNPDYGPEPGRQGCRVPPELLHSGFTLQP